MIIRNALVGEAEIISNLALRSKAYWGYSKQFMDACVEELTVSEGCIVNPDIQLVVAEIKSTIVGYYALEGLNGNEIELGALFVEPNYIGCGIGKALIEDAKIRAFDLGARKINIQGDPNAAHFYIAAGGKLTGEKESESISGRFLPTYQISL